MFRVAAHSLRRGSLEMAALVSRPLWVVADQPLVRRRVQNAVALA
jgi:hypothetical protein